MFLSKIAVEKPVLITMMIVVFIVFGIIAYIGLPLNLMPEFDIPYISISTVYPGAGPREIETQITRRIEDAVATISQIDNIQSYSMDNVGISVIQFKIGKDVNIANQEVKDKIDAILSEFPSDSQRPIIQKIDIHEFPFMEIVLSGKLDGRTLYDIADKRLKDRFSQIEGVANVNVAGGNRRQINVKLNERTVFENSISLAQLAQILAASNLDMPAGQFVKGSREYSVRLKGEFQSIEQLKETEIPTSTGNKKLKHIAVVEDSSERVRQRAVFFNNLTKQQDDNIVRLSLVKSPEGNVVDIAKEVAKQLPDIQKELPEEVMLSIIRDDSDFIQSSVNDTMSNILLGVLLTGLILFIFLHDLRSTLIVGLSMPISIIATFLFIRISGFTMNVMTLMGLSTSVGILVTNSIVVLENIFRHKDMGNNKKEAAHLGTSEITVAVLASTLTNVVVFLPIATMTTMVGQVFKEFGLTVTYATLISLLVSFTITPMLASRLIPEKKISTKFGNAFDNLFEKFSIRYERILMWILHNKKRAGFIIISTIVILVLSFGVVPFLGSEMMPQMDQGYINVLIELPQGSSLDETAKTINNINQIISKRNEVKYIVTSLGTQGRVDTGTNLASTDVQLVDARLRKTKTIDMVPILISDLSVVPNARIKVAAAGGFGGFGAPIEFFLKGHDIDKLEEIKEEVVSKIRDVPGLINLDTSSRKGNVELTIIPDRVKMSEVGVTVFDLAFAIRSAVEGTVSTAFREMGNEYDISISMDDNSVNSPDKISNQPISVRGSNYLLSQLADVSFSHGVNKIIRMDKSRAIQFTGFVARGANLGEVTNSIQNELNDMTLPIGYNITFAGEGEELANTMQDMLMTFILAVLLTYMLLAAILESFTQPLIIMATVPLALIGVFSSMFLAGTTINIFSMIAITMLVGIVVNNAILIMDYTNIQRKKGITAHDALLDAGRHKLKPIIMSTLSIIIGMLPMALGIGAAGRELRQPMGIVSIGGLIVSAFLTLILIPSLYLLTTKSETVKNP